MSDDMVIVGEVRSALGEGVWDHALDLATKLTHPDLKRVWVGTCWHEALQGKGCELVWTLQRIDWMGAPQHGIHGISYGVQRLRGTATTALLGPSKRPLLKGDCNFDVDDHGDGGIETAFAEPMQAYRAEWSDPLRQFWEQRLCGLWHTHRLKGKYLIPQPYIQEVRHTWKWPMRRMDP